MFILFYVLHLDNHIILWKTIIGSFYLKPNYFIFLHRKKYQILIMSEHSGEVNKKKYCTIYTTIFLHYIFIFQLSVMNKLLIHNIHILLS